MKKRWIIMAFCCAVAFYGCGKTQKPPEDVTFDADQELTMQEEGDAPEVIAAEEATKLAVTNAGLKEEDVQILDCNLAKDHDRMVYKVIFSTEKTKYEYSVDASSGSIIAFSQENAVSEE